MNVEDFSKDITKRFGTSDVFRIAEKTGLKIFYESWIPVTFGEYDRRKKAICVNLQALKKDAARRFEKRIVAHELGHFFAADLNLDKAGEEKFAREFAAALTGKENENGA